MLFLFQFNYKNHLLKKKRKAKQAKLKENYQRCFLAESSFCDPCEKTAPFPPIPVIRTNSDYIQWFPNYQNKTWGPLPVAIMCGWFGSFQLMWFLDLSKLSRTSFENVYKNVVFAKWSDIGTPLPHQGIKKCWKHNTTMAILTGSLLFSHLYQIDSQLKFVSPSGHRICHTGLFQPGMPIFSCRRKISFPLLAQLLMISYSMV